MLSDLRFALRQLSKAPGFSATIVVTLALGIGACTTIFSAVDSILLRPYDDPAMARNVRVRTVRLTQQAEQGVSFAELRAIEEQAITVEFVSGDSFRYLNVTGGAEPLRVFASRSTARHFDMFGIRIGLGRNFTREEQVDESHRVAILSHGFWQQTFGGSPDILGQSLVIHGQPHTVVGIATEHRHLRRSIYLPWPPAEGLAPSARSARGVAAYARLKSGVTLAQFQAELDLIATRLAQAYPDTNQGIGFVAYAESELSTRSIAPTLTTLFGAVACVLLIACANVANLLLARATVRQREMAVRAALGASRGRLIRLWLTESTVLGLLGGGLGLLLALWGIELIRASVPSSGNISTGVSQLIQVSLNPVVLGFGAALSLLTALLFGLVPAVLATRVNLQHGLKQTMRTSTGGPSGGNWRSGLVISQVALALVLLTCAGLLIRSFVARASVDLGFDRGHAAFLTLAPRTERYGKIEPALNFAESVLANIRRLEGVESAAVITWMPLILAGGGPRSPFLVEGRPPVAAGEQPLTNFGHVTADYLQAMRIQLRKGRWFNERDGTNSPRVVVINESLARTIFPNEDPIGKRLNPSAVADGWREIVGVVADVAQYEIGEPPALQLYAPLGQARNLPVLVFIARTRGNADHLAGLLKAQVYAVDKDQPIGNLSTLENMLHLRLTPQRLAFQLLLILALIALTIAAVGVYGVLAYTVGQRTTEIGIRMALGAQNTDVLRLVLGHGAWLVGAGVVVGLGASLAIGRLIESLLFQTSARDPLTLAAITLIFAAVAALACWIPARPTGRLSPCRARRSLSPR